MGLLWLFAVLVILFALAFALAPFLFVALGVAGALVVIGIVVLAIVLALEWAWVEIAWFFAQLRVIAGHPTQSFDEWLAARREDRRWWRHVRDYRKGRRVPRY